MRNQGRGEAGVWLAHDRLGYKEGDFPVTEKAGRTSVEIPFHNRITEDEVDYVAEVLEGALGERVG